MISNGQNGNGQSGEAGSTPPGAAFYPNRELLAPDVEAPLPLSPNTAPALHTVILQLFCVHEVHQPNIETAAGTATSLLLGFQDLVIQCNSLLQAPNAEELRGDVRRVLAACRQIHSCQDGLYVLHQASESLPDAATRDYDEPSEYSRMKNYGALLEDFFLSPPCTVTLEIDALARLQVQLDEVYDGACRGLELFYQAVTRAASPFLFGHCCRRLYEETRTIILPGNIDVEDRDATAGDDSDPPVDGGLLELLPALEKSID